MTSARELGGAGVEAVHSGTSRGPVDFARSDDEETAHPERGRGTPANSETSRAPVDFDRRFGGTGEKPVHPERSRGTAPANSGTSRAPLDFARGERESARPSSDREPARSSPDRSAPRAHHLNDLLALALALGLWSLVALIDIGGRPLLAGPLATLGAVSASLGLDLLATLARAAAGLFLGTILGLTLGVLVAAAARVAPVVDALLDFFRSIPPVVLLPSLLLALGYDDRARVTTVALGCAVIIAASVTSALRAPPSPRAELLRLAGASWLQQLRWTQPWEALPTLLAGLRIAAAMAVVVATVTEMVAGAPSGIGARVVSAQVAGQTPELTAAIFAIGLAGWALNALLRALEKRARRRSA